MSNELNEANLHDYKMTEAELPNVETFTEYMTLGGEIVAGCVVVSFSRSVFKSREELWQRGELVGSANYLILGRNYDQDTAYKLIAENAPTLWEAAKQCLYEGSEKLGGY